MGNNSAGAGRGEALDKTQNDGSGLASQYLHAPCGVTGRVLIAARHAAVGIFGLGLPDRCRGRSPRVRQSAASCGASSSVSNSVYHARRIGKPVPRLFGVVGKYVNRNRLKSQLQSHQRHGASPAKRVENRVIGAGATRGSSAARGRAGRSLCERQGSLRRPRHTVPELRPSGFA